MPSGTMGEGVWMQVLYSVNNICSHHIKPHPPVTSGARAGHLWQHLHTSDAEWPLHLFSHLFSWLERAQSREWQAAQIKGKAILITETLSCPHAGNVSIMLSAGINSSNMWPPQQHLIGCDAAVAVNQQQKQRTGYGLKKLWARRDVNVNSWSVMHRNAVIVLKWFIKCVKKNVDIVKRILWKKQG